MFTTQYLMKIAVGALMVFTVFPIRQYARNSMAVKLGDETPLREGKLTLNPFAHIDPVGVIFMILIGFGWGKSGHINPNNFKCKNKKLGMIAVALAGPVSNILFAFVMSLVYVAGYKLGMNDTLKQIISYIMILNLNLAVFLLLPVPGFDGGDIIMQFLPPKFIWKYAKYFQYVSLAVILLVIWGPLGSLISWIVSGIAGVLITASDLITGLFIR